MCGLSCSTSTVLQPVESVIAPEVVGIGLSVLVTNLVASSVVSQDFFC